MLFLVIRIVKREAHTSWRREARLTQNIHCRPELLGETKRRRGNVRAAEIHDMLRHKTHKENFASKNGKRTNVITKLPPQSTPPHLIGSESLSFLRTAKKIY